MMELAFPGGASGKETVCQCHDRWSLKSKLDPCPDLCSFPRQTIQHHNNPSQVYAPTTNAKEGEVEWIYDLQDLLGLTPNKDVLFIIGDWNGKVGSQETPGLQANLALEYRMKQGKG